MKQSISDLYTLNQSISSIMSKSYIFNGIKFILIVSPLTGTTHLVHTYLISTDSPNDVLTTIPLSNMLISKFNLFTILEATKE